jgi:hypothetical protein
MASKFGALKAAMSPGVAGESPPRWADVLRDLAAATYSKPTREAEQLMVAALQFGGALRAVFDDVSEMPHGMTPEEMVRSLAAQTLGEWRGAHCRWTLRRVAATVTSATLASVIEAVIEAAAEKAACEKGRRQQAEPVARLHPQGLSRVFKVGAGAAGQDEVTRHEFGDRVLRESLIVVQDFGMTAVAPSAPWRPRQTA